MREYHIYMQRTKCAEGHFNYIIYRWLPWEYVGYVEGTKELYTYFKSEFPYSMRSINFYHSFNYFDDEYFKINNDWDFMANCPHEYHRYLIIDDHGNVRDFYQLTKKYKKKTIIHYGTRGGGWSSHCANLTSDQRKSITPEEIRGIKDEYGITFRSIKPKRNLDYFWDNVKCSKVSGWKMQSKRRKQWKPKEGI